MARLTSCWNSYRADLAALRLVAQQRCTTSRSIAPGSKQCIASLSSALLPHLVNRSMM